MKSWFNIMNFGLGDNKINIFNILSQKLPMLRFNKVNPELSPGCGAGIAEGPEFRQNFITF
jgi:hypothetical protein